MDPKKSPRKEFYRQMMSVESGCSALQGVVCGCQYQVLVALADALVSVVEDLKVDLEEWVSRYLDQMQGFDCLEGYLLEVVAWLHCQEFSAVEIVDPLCIVILVDHLVAYEDANGALLSQQGNWPQKNK